MSVAIMSIPTNVEEGIVGANVNSSMLFNYLMGIYTMVYGWTIWIYTSKKHPTGNRRVILSAITLLYLLCFFDFIFQWYFLDWSVIINGDTRQSIFLSSLGGPSWMGVLTLFFFNLLIFVSDSLMIWRCYNVWGRSRAILLGLMILLIAESGLLVASTTLIAFTSTLRSSSSTIILSNNIGDALTFVSLATTLTTTLLIGYKIHVSSLLSPSASKRLFNRITTMVIESAVAYSLLLIMSAVVSMNRSLDTVGSPGVVIQYYIEIFILFAAGISPTILVARIALMSDDPSPTLTRISGLQFDRTTDNPAANDGQRNGVDTSVQIQSEPRCVGLSVMERAGTGEMIRRPEV